MKGLIDTNILIDYLRGDSKAKKELELYQDPAISVITWMEVMVGAEGVDEETQIRSFLSRFRVIPIDQEIAEATVQLRRNNRVKLPDAIIWGTAQTQGCPLVTRDVRDFPRNHPSIRIPY